MSDRVSSATDRRLCGGEAALGSRPGTLVVEQLRPPLLLLRGQAVDVLGRPGGDGEAALNGGTRAELVEPAFEIFELPDVLTLRLPADRPGIADHVGDGVIVAGDIAPVIEAVVEHAVKPVRLVGEAADGVGLVALLVAETPEVPALAELRPLIG